MNKDNTEDRIDHIIEQPLTTGEGYINPACIKELEQEITNMPKTYERCNNDPEWNRQRWIFVKDVTSYFAKWAISQSPYPYPENLENVVRYLHACLIRQADKVQMMRLSLCQINKMLYEILYEQGIKDFDKWNQSKNPGPNITFTSIYDNKPNPDDDFIDLDALLHNVCISLRDEFRKNDAFDKKFEEKYGKLSANDL